MTLKPVDTAIIMVVGPCIDDTDFKTLEESIAYNAAGMDVSLIVEKTDGTSAVTAITLTTAGTSDWTHKDGGYYEVEITAAQNAEEGIAYLRGVCTGVLPFESPRYDVVKANIYDSLIKGTDVLQADVTQWLGTAAAAPTVAGVPEVDITHLLGTAWLAPGVAGTPDVNAKLLGGTSQTGRDVGASVLLSAGTGAGQLDFTSGIVKSNLTQILAHLLTQTGTQLADGFEHFFDVGTPTGTVDSLPAAAPNAAGGIPISAAGGLDLDTKLANTNEITAARMGALTDWINGGRLDLILDIIANDTTVDIPALIATAQADLDIITGADGALLAAGATSAQLIDDLWDEILSGATHNIAGSAGRRVREIGAYAIESGTAQAGNSHSITLAATSSAVDGTYNRNLIVLTDNTGVGQTRTIVDYDGSTKVAVIDRDWRTSPDATTTYQVTADNTPLVTDQGVARGGTATTITLRTYASSTNDTYQCNVLAIIAGTGRGQARLVGAYNGTSKVVTICGDNWITNPDTTSVYVLMPYGTTCTSCIGTYALGLIKSENDDAFTDYDPPTRTEATSDKDEIITEVDANETKIDALQTDSTAIKAKTDALPSGIAKNVALSGFNIFMVLSADHVTPATGKTVTGTISKDGAAFNALTNAISEIASGMYKVDITQAEMNADVVTVKFTETDCDQRIITIYTS